MKKQSLVQVVFMLSLSLMPAADASHAQNVYTVTNSGDSGDGSLRAGFYDPAPTILFDIPRSDPGYDPVNRVWVIKPETPYHVPAGKIIDGRLAAEGGGFRPGIEIDGAILGQSGSTGIYLNEGAVLRGVVIHSCGYGIWVSKRDVTISDCHIGTDASGMVAKPNNIDGVLLIHGAQNAYLEANLVSGNGASGIRISGSATGFCTVVNNRIGTNADGSAAIPNTADGVSIHANAKSNFIEGNLISGNNWNGITVSGDSTSGNNIRGNKIGTNWAGDAALGNGNAGIVIEGGSTHNLIEENLVSGNSNIGIHLKDAGTHFNLIRCNRIGCDAAGTAAIPNVNFGIALFNGPCHNVIGRENIIAFNGKTGVLVDGAGSLTGTIGNTITRNAIFANGSEGIRNFRGGNSELTPPLLTGVSATEVSGTTVAGQIVEVFADENGQGKVFLGSTVADFSGDFTLALSTPPTLPQITATAADYMGSTSAFSIPMATAIRPGTAEHETPNRYRLRQNYPNPFNPVTHLQYELPRAGDVLVAIYDRSGRLLRRLVDCHQPAGIYLIQWNATDDNGTPAAAGLYFCTLRAGRFEQRIKVTLVR